MLKQATHGLKEALLGMSPLEPEDDSDDEGAAKPSLAGHDLRLHRAAFANDAAAVATIARTAPALLTAFDAQGNTPLHVAVLARSRAAAEALLAAGVSVEVTNARKWNPLDEAVALKASSMALLWEVVAACFS